jgi:DNA-binding CsgD family transcriptional regulator
MLLSKIQEIDIVNKYLAGSSTYKLAIEYGVSTHPISNILKQHKIKSRIFRSSDVQLILSKFNDGITPKQIAKDLRISNRVVYKHLNNNGINLNKTYYADKTFFKIIDTEEKAYWLGFCYADLYVYEPYDIQLTLGAKDLNHLKKFKKSLSAEHPIISKYSTAKNGKRYLGYKIRIGSKEIVECLLDKGCTQAKSNTIEFPPPNVPKELLKPFIVGYFDGDGSIYRNKKDGAWHISIDCNLHFGTFLQEYLMFRCDLNRTKLKEESGGDYKICYGGNFQVARIGHFLYDSATICLDRKKKEFEKLYYFLEHRVPQKRIPENQVKQIVEWYSNGISMRKIAQDLNITMWSIRSHLTKRGIYDSQRNQNYMRHQYNNGFKTYVNNGTRLNKNAHS